MKLILLNVLKNSHLSTAVDTAILRTSNALKYSKIIDYTEKQIQALQRAKPMNIITGGPGTGKTTLIDGFLDCYM